MCATKMTAADIDLDNDCAVAVSEVLRPAVRPGLCRRAAGALRAGRQLPAVRGPEAPAGGDPRRHGARGAVDDGERGGGRQGKEEGNQASVSIVQIVPSS